ncbi:hypothetical protein [Pseudomonas sp. NPDC089534]|uniref:hypothetical protein n=1 Tax=Pseudomonas sp. NPDC089534 TaxID=3364468 RepID=UPI003823A862
MTAKIKDQPDFHADVSISVHRGARWEIRAIHAAQTGNPADQRELKFYVPLDLSEPAAEKTYALHISSAEDEAMATYSAPPSLALSREGTLTVRYCASQGTMIGSFAFMGVSSPCDHRYLVSEGHFTLAGLS